jgi:hypothetical protein
MSKLGDFLESVCGPGDLYQTLQATIRHVRFTALAEQAGDSVHRIGRRKHVAAISSQKETTISVWMAVPDRLRIETEEVERGQLERSITVVNGQRSWVRDDQGHVETGSGSRQAAALACLIERHFDRGRLRDFLPALSLSATGDVVAAGSNCVRVRAIPRPDAQLWPHWIPYGADEYELHCEPRRGVVLSIIARRQGQPFEVNEVTEVAFDGPIDQTLFTHTPQAGEQATAPVPATERLSLAAAKSRVSFAVLVPARIPYVEHAHCEVLYRPPRINAPRASLTLYYRFSLGHLPEDAPALWITQSGDAFPDDGQFEWEQVNYGGRQWRISDPGTDGMRIVRLEHAGTFVDLTSSLDRLKILDLAASLVPA